MLLLASRRTDAYHKGHPCHSAGPTLATDSEVSRGLKLAGQRGGSSGPVSIDTVAVPLLGTIAAGSPFPMPENDTWSDLTGQELIDLPQAIVGRGDGLYALKVRGESLSDALISDGDLVIR